VGIVEHGRIARINEYLDSAHLATLGIRTVTADGA
jgi:hypothetical protein